MNYLDHPAHAAWREHYFQGNYSSWHLAIDPAWWQAHMPKGFKSLDPADRDHSYAFQVEYLDRTDGKKYETKMYVAWDDYDEVYFPGFDENWNHLNALGVKALMGYFYNEHTCPCHRKQDAASAGAVTDDECEGDRFQIARIWDPNHPGLILYSETMTSEELEAALQETRHGDHARLQPDLGG